MAGHFLLTQFLSSDIGSLKGHDGEVAQHAAGDAIPIALAELIGL